MLRVEEAAGVVAGVKMPGFQWVGVSADRKIINFTEIFTNRMFLPVSKIFVTEVVVKFLVRHVCSQLEFRFVVDLREQTLVTEPSLRLKYFLSFKLKKNIFPPGRLFDIDTMIFCH